jgi:hypothetical protein
VIADRRELAAGDIQPPQVALLDRDIFAHHRALAVGREAGDRPAAALDLRDKAVGRRIARVHHVKIGIDAVAARGAVGDPLAVMAEGVEFVAALAIGQQRQAPFFSV